MIRLPALALAGLALATPATLAAPAATPVSIELVLAVDSSASVNDDEYALQMNGIAAALEHPHNLAAIAALPEGLALTVMIWSGGHLTHQVVPWVHLTDEASILEFAAAARSAPRTRIGNLTAIGYAIEEAVNLIEGNAFEGRYRRIDVSGDGRSNSGTQPWILRDWAVARGYTINGLAILDGDSGLGEYYADNVIGGPGAFVLTARSFDDFAEAMARKLGRELSFTVSGGPVDRVAAAGPH